MGYFPNGTAGDMYEARYCARCIHEDHDKGCPVMLLHLLYNYDECNNEGSFLHTLIPRDKDGWNEQCSMFIAVVSTKAGRNRLADALELEQ
ncbi:MAG: hypothetical protein ACR2QF_09325 [Geminicoccaceae bacterium]